MVPLVYTFDQTYLYSSDAMAKCRESLPLLVLFTRLHPVHLRDQVFQLGSVSRDTLKVAAMLKAEIRSKGSNRYSLLAGVRVTTSHITAMQAREEYYLTSSLIAICVE